MHTMLDNIVPNLLRHLFPSSRFPKSSFSEESLPARVPREAWCVDSTLALGLPEIDRLLTEQIVELFEHIDRINCKSGLIRQAEVVVGGESEREAIRLLRSRTGSGDLTIEPVALLLPDPTSVDLIRGLGLREAGIQVGASDYMLAGSKETSRRGSVERLLQVMGACLEDGLRVRIDLLDITRADLDGFVLPFMDDCMSFATSRGGSRLHFRFCDTYGVGLPWTESLVPRSVPRLIHTISHSCGLECDQMEFLGHNDLGLALANSLAAVVHGCATVVTSLGGLGERSGITPTELMFVHLAGHYGIHVDLKAATLALELLASLGGHVGPRHPLWGERAMVRSFPPHEGAMVETFPAELPLDPERLLGRSPVLEIRRGNGAPGLVQLIRQHLPDAGLSCEDEPIRQLAGWLEEQVGERVRWEDVEGKVRELLPDQPARQEEPSEEPRAEEKQTTEEGRGSGPARE